MEKIIKLSLILTFSFASYSIFPQSNVKRFAEEFVTTVEAGDSATLFSYYYSDFHYQDVIWGLEAHDLKVFKQALAPSFDKDGLAVQLEIVDVLISAKNNSFSLVGRFRNNEKEPWIEYISWIRLKDGKIAAHTDYASYDAESLLNYSPRFKK